MGHDECWRLAAALVNARKEYFEIPHPVRSQLIQDVRGLLHEALRTLPQEDLVPEGLHESAHAHGARAWRES